ncbi:hypothetical protein GWI33_007898 [Rhynchophorus ferrugineus]|uniref:Uncharacterized protein n=1 Tax=Rhynchophorus ferrugineus TaxID=354439 RepID=A0A834IS63_RHYFE|nr:hypothetical protein GWI33_007898 [Rhynchophorus ferrugineus]
MTTGYAHADVFISPFGSSDSCTAVGFVDAERDKKLQWVVGGERLMITTKTVDSVRILFPDRSVLSLGLDNTSVSSLSPSFNQGEIFPNPIMGDRYARFSRGRCSIFVFLFGRSVSVLGSFYYSVRSFLVGNVWNS